jgi:hypothetical protein
MVASGHFHGTFAAMSRSQACVARRRGGEFWRLALGNSPGNEESMMSEAEGSGMPLNCALLW